MAAAAAPRTVITRLVVRRRCGAVCAVSHVARLHGSAARSETDTVGGTEDRRSSAPPGVDRSAPHGEGLRR